MTASATTDLLTLDEVAEKLHVGKTTVETWVRNKDLASFKKGKNRLVSQEDLTRFVLLNTVKPRRPDWADAKVESDFVAKLKGIMQQLQNEKVNV